MGDEDVKGGAGTPDRLVDRLQKQLHRLETAKNALAYNKDLEDAVRDLRQDVEDLKVMAPHVWSLPRLRR